MSGRESQMAALVAMILVAMSPAPASGQDVDTRVRNAGADQVSFRFATWPEVERCSSGWMRRGIRENRGGGLNRDLDCWSGPAEVRLEIRGGEVRSVDTEIVRAESAPDDRWTSIGTVAPSEAADYLLDLAENADANVGEDALAAATMADGVETWPRMLELARNGGLDRDIRTAATFWVGQASADQVLDGLRGLVDDPDTEVRQAALFALSENQGENAVPLLMEIAEGDGDPDVRRSAFFWLSQKEDPRVLAFFERVLRDGGAS